MATDPSDPSEEERSVLDWPRRAGQTEAFRAAVARRLRLGRVAVTAGASAVLAFALVLVLRPAHPPSVADTGELAATSHLLRQTLPDGSVIELAGGAAASFAYSSAYRHISLRQGRAHFEVAKNPRRPFVVQARGVGVTAIGTAFDVVIEDQEVDVLVTEGRVAVNRSFVSQGERAVVPLSAAAPSTRPAKAVVAPVAPLQLAELTAWRADRLELNATPLADVLAAIQSRSRVRIALADRALGRLQLSGSLRVDEIGPLLETLAANYGIVADRQPDGSLLLHAQARP